MHNVTLTFPLFRTKSKDGEDPETALSLACAMGSDATARVLLSHGADPSEVDDGLETVEDLELLGHLDQPYPFYPF